MSLTPGTRLGVYEITALIGVGGMGEVYKATDTNLKRAVAVKVLPALVAADVERLARFQREAEVLAALNHPNIAAIYGLERSSDMTALVMELVEGDDLSQRVAKGTIPIDEALQIAKQIAEALEAAHEQGIIHRDLKPANIKVRADGTVKVLDFGLAKAMEPTAGSSPSLTQSPTLTTPAMTQAGMILGTAAYMSPEQARGKVVDKRADIWAFGAVLFEMLTGQRAFGGEDIAQTLANVINKEPEWQALPTATPARIRSIIARCLVKDPRQRVRDMGDVRLALEGAFETAGASSIQTPTASSRGRWLWMAAFAVASLVAVALAVPAVRYLREALPTSPPETRLDIVTPATDSPTSFALSPDGRQIVFVGAGEGGAGSRLWLRSLGSSTAQPLGGTEGSTDPFWSPDSRSIGFFAEGALKRLDVGQHTPQTLAPAPAGFGGSWNTDGLILFAPSLNGPIMRVSAAGGAAVAVTTVGPQETSHVAPQVLPDGHRFLFYVLGGRDTTGIYLGSLDGRASTRLTSSNTAGHYLPTSAWDGGGRLLWERAGTLVGQRLDLATAALVGEPITLAEGLAVEARLYRSAVSVAATGLVAYRPGADSERQLTWFDRSGVVRGVFGDSDRNDLLYPRLSPDGRRVVVSRTVQGNVDLWLLDGTRKTRLTFDPAEDRYPLWSPDGSRLAFISNRTNVYDIYAKQISGAGTEERLVTSDQTKSPSGWSPDGRFLLFNGLGSPTNSDIWVLPMGGDRKPWPFLKTSFSERYGVFSTDGQWVAYQSNESGRNEVYVRPFAQPGAAGTTGEQWQVSTSGGITPLWAPDGKELYYIDPTGAMMAAPFTVTAATFGPSAPVALFATRIYGGGVEAFQWRQYDVTADGRFLINMVLDSAAAPITLIQNWQPDSKK